MKHLIMLARAIGLAAAVFAGGCTPAHDAGEASVQYDVETGALEESADAAADAAAGKDFEAAADAGDMAHAYPSFDSMEPESMGIAPAPRPRLAAAAPRPPKGLLRTVDILFGTDRAPDPTVPGGFSSVRGRRLTLGSTTISVPARHRPGAVERPLRILFVEEREDRARHFTFLKAPRTMSEQEFLAAIAAKPQDKALLFVHGYNTPFDGGLYRTAQLATDLKVYGPVFHYSWPSAGSVLAYDYDSASAHQARVHFQRFLDMIVERTGTRKLIIIAHSKGNDMVLEALDDIAARSPAAMKRCCAQLVLASPDVDRDRAEQILGQIGGLFDGVTLYANDNDIPLEISKRKAGGVPRAGELMEDKAPLIVPGLDSIDATSASFDLFGYNHNAYVFDPVLRDDLAKLVATGLRPPQQRTPQFVPRVAPRGAYWQFVP